MLDAVGGSDLMISQFKKSEYFWYRVLLLMVTGWLLAAQTPAIQAQENLQVQIYLDRTEARAAAQGMIFGNPDGEITVYKFFDYNCGYCRRAATFMADMISLYPEVKLVVIDNAVLGPASRETAIAISQLSPELRRKAHFQAMAGGRRNGAWVSAFAKQNGEQIIDPASDADPVIQAIKKDLAFNYSLSNALGFSGVPAFIVNGQRIKGLNPAAIEKILCGYEGLGSCDQSGRLLFADAQNLLKAGDRSQARVYFQKASNASAKSQDSQHLNSLCWNGAKAGFGSEILPSCDHAISLHPKSHAYRDSRGLARALTGDFSGASEDFQYWIDSNEKDPKKAKSLAIRKQMMAAIKDKNADEIENLRLVM